MNMNDTILQGLLKHDTIRFAAITGKDWLGLILISFVLPAIFSLIIHAGVRRLGWVKDGDLKLN